ncbi:MAG: acetyl/propionyl-CoA carboxylase subunit alpha, partial [Actinomycetota bacterium]|nr:acetyl/propionyl-CoA carboxylase subunit alpha [Actinomycetota bacterium]
CAFGLDLVAQQIAVAEGRALDGAPPQPRGHAIEVRLYAEDPAQDWQAQSGPVHRFEVPGVDVAFATPASYGLRVDSGVESGSEVSPHYDAMLAKVVAWAPTRDTAARRLAGALAASRIHGVRTNRDLLVGVLRDPAFLGGCATTAYLSPERVIALGASPHRERWVRVGALAAAVCEAERRRTRFAPAAWRNVSSQPQQKSYLVGGDEVVARYRDQRDRLVPCDLDGVEIVEVTTSTATMRVDGVEQRFDVAAYGDGVVAVDSAQRHVDLRRQPRFVDPQEQVDAGSLLAPMPCSVVSVAVSEGERVEAGRPVVVLEAMKMQHTIRAHEPGTVAALSVQVGQQVDAGAVLAVITPEGDDR